MQSSNMPLVSVITSTYNRAEMLKRAIESVCAQSFTQWEHIVVGDCTPDNSEEVVGSFNDDRIRFYNLPEKSPPGSHGALAKNHGIFEMAKGRYVAYLDDDDAYQPDFLSVMMRYFSQHSEAQFLYCLSIYCDKTTGKRMFGNPFQRFMHGYSKEKLKRFNFLNTNCVIHTMDLIQKVDGWNPDYYFDDYELWLRMSEECDFHHIRRFLIKTYVDEPGFFGRLATKGVSILRHGRHTPVE